MVYVEEIVLGVDDDDLNYAEYDGEVKDVAQFDVLLGLALHYIAVWTDS